MKFYEAFRILTNMNGYSEGTVVKRTKLGRERIRRLLHGVVKPEYEVERARYLFLAMGYPMEWLARLTNPGSPTMRQEQVRQIMVALEVLDDRSIDLIHNEVCCRMRKHLKRKPPAG